MFGECVVVNFRWTAANSRKTRKGFWMVLLFLRFTFVVHVFFYFLHFETLHRLRSKSERSPNLWHSERKDHRYFLPVRSEITSTSEPNTSVFWNCLFELSVMCFPCFSFVWCGLRPSPLCFLMVWKDETCFRPKCWESLRLSRALWSQRTACVFLLKFSLSYI